MMKKLGSFLSNSLSEKKYPTNGNSMQTKKDYTVKTSKTNGICAKTTGCMAKAKPQKEICEVGTQHGVTGLNTSMEAQTVISGLTLMKKALKDSTKHLLDEEIGATFPSGGGVKYAVMKLVNPKPASEERIVELKRYLAGLNKALMGGGDSQVSYIQRLMLHYWTQETKAELKTLAWEDWIEDIEEFPEWAVKDACKKWRRSQEWAPKPKQFRDICKNIVWRYEYERSRILKTIEITEQHNEQ